MRIEFLFLTQRSRACAKSADGRERAHKELALKCSGEKRFLRPPARPNSISAPRRRRPNQQQSFQFTQQQSNWVEIMSGEGYAAATTNNYPRESIKLEAIATGHCESDCAPSERKASGPTGCLPFKFKITAKLISARRKNKLKKAPFHSGRGVSNSRSRGLIWNSHSYADGVYRQSYFQLEGVAQFNISGT